MTKKAPNPKLRAKPAPALKPVPAPVVIDHTAHGFDDECLVCGYGMTMCPFCGVQNRSPKTKTCGACGKKSR